MRRLDANDVTCEVRTYKEGVFSRVGHDLLLRVERMELKIEGDPTRLEAVFDAGSIRVVCAMNKGQPAHGTLSSRERAEVERHLVGQVLLVARHPHIHFVSEPFTDDTPTQVSGQLTICGRSRSISSQVARHGDRLVAEFEIDQRDFGIRPFSAMLGALKVKAHVRVQVSVPAGPTTL